MNQLLFIVGPTATGKTSLGLKLAQKFPGQIISADSRQVYRGMDIGTGKDLSEKSLLKKSSLTVFNQPLFYYQIKNTNLWGYDLVDPDQDFNVSHFYQISWTIIKHIWKLQQLPIIVGGTGFYIKSILNPPETSYIPPDPKLRLRLQKKSVAKLQQILASIDSKKLDNLNHSDQHNPHRLIRAIEIAHHRREHPKYIFPQSETKLFMNLVNPLYIGLKTSLTKLDSLISHRVTDRINLGFDVEVDQLITSQQLLPQSQASKTLGYQQWLDYKRGKISQEEATALWKQAERQYARRQLTWFKKQPHINWIDSQNPKLVSLVVQKVKSWYS